MALKVQYMVFLYYTWCPVSLNAYKLGVLEKIKAAPHEIPELTPELSEDVEFILEALKISANVWQQVSISLKSNKKFILLAIEQDANAFIFAASDELKDDEDVVLAATKKDSGLLLNASDRLKSDESFKNKATKVNSWFPLIRFPKIIKNNLFEGLADTFAMMHGDYGIATRLDGGELSSNRLKYGLIDITFIPQLSNTLINFALPNKPSLSNPFKFQRDEERWHTLPLLRTAALIIGLGLQVLRFGMAFLATIIVSPLVVVVHAIKFPYAYYKQRQLFGLQGEICRFGESKPISGITTLGEFAQQTHSSLNDLCAAQYYNSQENDLTTASSKNLEISRYGSLRSSSALLFFRPINTESPSQKNVLKTVSNLEINDKYNFNDFEDIAIGRSFR